MHEKKSVESSLLPSGLPFIIHCREPPEGKVNYIIILLDFSIPQLAAHVIIVYIVLYDIEVLLR